MITIKRALFAALALLACALATPANAACAGGFCYVRAGAQNSNSTSAYALTTGGGSCTCTPGTTDVVVLDSNSGNYTINAALSIGALDASGTATGASGSPYVGTLTQQPGLGLTINTAAANSLLFSTGMTYAPSTNTTTIVTFAHMTGTALLTSAGKNFTAITVNTTSGLAGVQQADDINITNAVGITVGSLTLTSGIWDANGHAITASGILSSNTNPRTLILGGLVKLGGNLGNAIVLWNTATGVGSSLTFTKNSANIEIIAPTSAIQGMSFSGGGLTFNALTLDNLTTNTGLSIIGNNSFSSVTIGSGWTIIMSLGAIETLSGALTVNGTSSNWSSIITANATGVSTFTVAGACAATWTVLWGITGTAGCAATNSINLGANANWSISAPTFGGGGGGGASGVPGTVM